MAEKIVITSKTKNELLLLVGCLAVLGAAFFVPAVAAIVMVALWVLIILAVSYRLTWGWLVLVLLSPMINWQFDMGVFQRFFSPYPWLYHMHAPVVEFWAVIVFCAFIVHSVRRLRNGESLVVQLPSFGWFALFVASAVFSLVNAPPAERLDSVKYISHFMLFLYFGYIVLSANVIASKKLWRQSLATLAGAGFLGALMGAASLVLGVWYQNGFHRAVPFAILGWAPFGDQHIFLAEVITTTLPIFIFFWRQENDFKKKRVLMIMTWFVFAVGMLTLSRAGWITMFVEGVVFLWLTRGEGYWPEIKKRLHYGLFVLPIFAYLLYFLTTSPVVTGSTSSRSYLLDMALFLFKQHPIVGQGVGTYTSRVIEYRAYQYEFGEVLDAQGVVQKILAEQGLVGLAAFLFFIGSIAYIIFQRYRSNDYSPEARGAYFVSIFLVISPFIFQLFNTDYYTSKMWVPIALAVSQSILYRQRLRSGLFTIRPKKSITIESTI